jgi:hypothetical protein
MLLQLQGTSTATSGQLYDESTGRKRGLTAGNPSNGPRPRSTIIDTITQLLDQYGSANWSPRENAAKTENGAGRKGRTSWEKGIKVRRPPSP